MPVAAAKDSAQPTWRVGALASAVLTPLAIAVHGYHPFAEDGGVYVAGIKRTLNSSLYPYWSGFITTHLKFSLFAPAVAAVARVTHAGLMPVLFALYAATMWLTLFAAWLLASRCAAGRNACLGAVTLLAMTLTIPVAGTSLMLMDPYVTARSLSTPCGLLMLVGALDVATAWSAGARVSWGAVTLVAGSFLVAAAMHPLMAAYALGCAMLLVALSLRARVALLTACGLLSGTVLAMAASIEMLGPVTTSAYAMVAQTRTYWFLSNWHLYELVGLMGPPVVVLLVWRRGITGERSAGARVAEMTAIAGASATVIAALFAEPWSRSYELAMLQPLRVYSTIYLVMLVALGAWMAEKLLRPCMGRRGMVSWAAAIVLAGGAMAFVQRETFPGSAHVELPGRGPVNAWTDAFEWVRGHTPVTAVFALDSKYAEAAGEDSQNFRAIADRSAMPDYAKDGGIAAIAPGLTTEWLEGESAQKGLAAGVGSTELARLRAYGVDWIIVPRETPLTIPCAYENAMVRVCRVR